MHLPIDRDAAPWETRPNCSSHLPNHAIFYITFVDDEAIMLAADTAQGLDNAIVCLLRCLESVFAAFRLTINWSRGKTEAILTYRGVQAGTHWRARFTSEGPTITTPSGAMLHIVAEYKHVGSIITENNNLAPEILKRAARALDAWYQLADRVFGSPHVPTSVKSSLAYSLIFTRLLYAAETWTTLTPASLRVLDTVQARVARRILGTWYTKHDSEDHTSDRADHTTNEEDRRSLGWPSIECELRRKRLAYAARICRYAPDTLRALLQARCAG